MSAIKKGSEQPLKKVLTEKENAEIWNKVDELPIEEEAHWESKEERTERLEEKLERIKTLMENSPRCCLDGGHYCERDAWLEELKKEMEGISNFETVKK